MPRLVLFSLILFGGFLTLTFKLQADPPSGPGGGPMAAPPFQYQGTTSCASTACHHGNGPRGARGSEYTTWMSLDTHARAFEALSDPLSLTIIKNLGPDTPKAEENPLCLNCHVQPGVRALGATIPARSHHERFTLDDGVGCEACHGPAEKWLARHYASDWKTLSEAEKVSLGMFPTKNLTFRTRLCTSCHVGFGDMDVNHDLIAAGHPRLNFEMAGFHARLPRHWDGLKDTKGRKDFEAQIWALGQVTSAHAALDLLHHRATASGKPWPEFAEHDCFACHHDLADQKWRRDPARVKGRLGSPGWGTWYTALHDVVGRHPPRPELPTLGKPLQELRGLLGGLGADRGKVRQQAQSARDALTEWMKVLGENEPTWDPASLARDLQARADADLGQAGWDEAAQIYLALAAMPQEYLSSGRGESLKQLRKDLEFPAPFDSPRGFSPGKLVRPLATPRR